MLNIALTILITLPIFRFVGGLFFSRFDNRDSLIKEVKLTFLGIVFLTSLTALIITSGKTILNILIIPLLIVIILDRKKIKLHHFLPDLKVSLLIGLLFLTFHIYFFILSGAGIEGEVHWLSNDVMFYSNVTDSIFQYKAESAFTVGGATIDYPYHYFEMWFAILLNLLLDVGHYKTLALYVYPLSYSILTVGLAFYIGKKTTVTKNIVIPIFIVLFSLNFIIPRLIDPFVKNWLNNYELLYKIPLLFFNYGKFAVVAPLILFSFDEFEKENFVNSTFFLTGIFVFSIIFFPGVSVMLIFIFILLAYRKSLHFKTFLILGIINITIFLWIYWDYLFTQNEASVTKSVNSGYPLIVFIEKFIKQTIIVGITGLTLFFSGKKKLFITFMLLPWVSSFVFWMVFNNQPEFFQFFTSWHLIICTISGAIILQFIYNKASKRYIKIIFFTIGVYVIGTHVKGRVKFQIETVFKHQRQFSIPFKIVGEVKNKYQSLNKKSVNSLFISQTPFRNSTFIGSNPFFALHNLHWFSSIHHISLQDGLILKGKSSSIFQKLTSKKLDVQTLNSLSNTYSLLLMSGDFNKELILTLEKSYRFSYPYTSKGKKYILYQK